MTKSKRHSNITTYNSYEQDYHSFFHKRLLSDKRYYLFRAEYSKRMYWSLFKNHQKGSFVEFGCGIGQNIFLQRQNTTGIDISDFALKKCGECGIKTEKRIEKLKDNSIDGILCCHVLEHIEEPAYYLRQFQRILKNEGRLVLVLPVTRGWYSTSPPDRKSWHLYTWTIPAIWALLENCGFNVKKAGFNYAAGFSLFYKLPFPLAMRMIKLVGHFRNQKEILIVAERS